MKRILSKKGFTLAETLITLGIIGVVATLTLPNLIANYKKKIYVAQLQKVYSQMSNAAAQILSDNRVDSIADTYMGTSGTVANENNVGKFLKTYFKVVNDCGVSSDSSSAKCFAATYKSLDGTKTAPGSTIMSNLYCVNLNIGATVCMSAMDGSVDAADNHAVSVVVVDVNGVAPPNTNGRDLFNFDLYSDTKIANNYADMSDYYTDGVYCQEKKSLAFYGGSCFSKVIGDGWKMDY